MNFFKKALTLKNAKTNSIQEDKKEQQPERAMSEKAVVKDSTQTRIQELEYNKYQQRLERDVSRTPVVGQSTSARIQELEFQNLALKRRIWKLQYAGTRRTAIILSSVGALCLLLSYYADSLILTFTGLGVVLWGVLMLYISPSRQVRAEAMSSTTSVMQKSIENLLTALGYTGDVIFFHPNSLKGLAHGYMFVSHLTARRERNSKSTEVLNLLPYSNESEVPTVYLHPDGIFIASPSQGLVDLYEKELNMDFATADLSQIQRTLPKLLIEDLRLVDDMEIVKNDDNTISVEISGGPYVHLCKETRKDAKSGTRRRNIGCVYCCSLALVFSKVIGKPVIISESPIQNDERLETIFEVMETT